MHPDLTHDYMNIETDFPIKGHQVPAALYEQQFVGNGLFTKIKYQTVIVVI